MTFQNPQLCASPQIINPEAFKLSTGTVEIFEQMFAQHQRVILLNAFSSGYSGSHVFLVQPILSDQDPDELPTVVKLASAAQINQEWQAYQDHIDEKLSGVATIASQPILSQKEDWGGLRYSLVGSGIFTVESLEEYCQHSEVANIWHVLEKRLFKRLGRFWKSSQRSVQLLLRDSYDRILPVNLYIKPLSLFTNTLGDRERSPGFPSYTLNAEQFFQKQHTIPAISQGEWIQVQGFTIIEIDRKGSTITLNVRPTDRNDETAFAPSYRIRLGPVKDIYRYHVGQVIEQIDGRVDDTRHELLLNYAKDALAQEVDLTAPELILPGMSTIRLPNPLLLLPSILAQSIRVNIATVHGDLNLQNILIDPDIHAERLIDFADTRRDHIMHDLLRLETEIITHFLSRRLQEANLSPQTIYRLYTLLHWASHPPGNFSYPKSLDPTLKKVFIILVTIRKMAQGYLYQPEEWTEYYQGLTLYLLATLKFNNLSNAAKQVAYWGAATIQQLLADPASCAEEITWLPLNSVLYTDTPFMAPPRPSYALVGRNDILNDLRQQLLNRNSLAISALNGLPGVGKTALAIELANDPNILDAFPDGVLWIGLGKDPDILALLGMWGAALGISSEEMSPLTTINRRAQRIHAAIGFRRMLLVIDDAWHTADALAFKIGGQNCTHILTTRSPDIAWEFAEKGAKVVDELDEENALILLASFVPELVEREMDAARRLVQKTGGLPLALILIGKYLQKMEYRGDPCLLQSTLQTLLSIEERLQVSQYLDPLNQQPSIASGTSLSLFASIQLSDTSLDETTRLALRALSVFPPKPNTFSKDAAQVVIDETSQILDNLRNAGLLERRGEERYTVHQTIADYTNFKHVADYAKFKHIAESARKRMVMYFVEYLKIYEREYHTLELENNNILTALEAASLYQMDYALIYGTNTFYHFLESRGLYTTATHQLNQAREAAERQNEQAGLMMTLFNLGRVAINQGNYDQAEQYSQRGIALPNASDYQQHFIRLISNRGEIAVKIGEFEQAEQFYQQALVLTEPLEDREQTSHLLANLGEVSMKRGLYSQAESYLQNGLELARQVGNSEQICHLLSNLGAVMENHGKFEEATVYLQEGLARARDLDHSELVSRLLGNLGNMATLCGAYDEAEAYAEEGLALAREIGHRENTADLLANLGDVAMKRAAYTKAESLFLSGLKVAREIGHKEIIGRLVVNLGDATLHLGKYEDSDAYLREGLDLANQVQHGKLTVHLLNSLGDVAAKQGLYEEAEKWYQQGLAKAEELDDSENIAHLKTNLGNVASKCEQYQKAETYYRGVLQFAYRLGLRTQNGAVASTLNGSNDEEYDWTLSTSASQQALRTSLKAGLQEYVAKSLYGLAQITYIDKDRKVACRQAEASLTILQSMGHGDTEEIVEWLNGLSDP